MTSNVRRSARARQPSLELVEAAANGIDEFFLAQDVALATTPSPKKAKSSRRQVLHDEGHVFHPTTLQLTNCVQPEEVSSRVITSLLKGI